jgi:hypothetical protein
MPVPSSAKSSVCSLVASFPRLLEKLVSPSSATVIESFSLVLSDA